MLYLDPTVKLRHSNRDTTGTFDIWKCEIRGDVWVKISKHILIKLPLQSYIMLHVL